MSADRPADGQRALVEWARSAPAGVLAISGVLALTGTGLVLGAVYLAVMGSVGWMPVVAGVVAGPLTVYVAVHLLRGTRWAWSTLLMVLLLLVISSIGRVLAARGIAAIPVVELAVETIAIVYLTRPSVRGTFRRR